MPFKLLNQWISEENDAGAALTRLQSRFKRTAKQSIIAPKYSN